MRSVLVPRMTKMLIKVNDGTMDNNHVMRSEMVP